MKVFITGASGHTALSTILPPGWLGTKDDWANPRSTAPRIAPENAALALSLQREKIAGHPYTEKTPLEGHTVQPGLLAD
jgi:hypothetical protein